MKKKNKTKKYYIVFLFLYFTTIACVFYYQYAKYNIYFTEEKKLLKAIEKEKELTATLNDTIDFYESDAYVEKIARERLGLVMPDEFIFVNELE